MNLKILRTVSACVGATVLMGAITPASANTFCMDFNNIKDPFVTSVTYDVAETIISQNGITMYPDVYIFDGIKAIKNKIIINKPRWATSNLLRLQKSAVRFRFDKNILGFYPKSITFKYYDIWKNINIRADDFLYLKEMPLGRAINLGRAEMKAGGFPVPRSLYGFASLYDHHPDRNVGFDGVLIGGDYLLIDDVCVSP